MITAGLLVWLYYRQFFVGADAMPLPLLMIVALALFVLLALPERALAALLALDLALSALLLIVGGLIALAA